MKLILTALALLAASPAVANDVRLQSEVLVERTVTGPDGQATTKLEAPKTVVPGDRVQIQLRYNNAGATPATDFTVVNPLPAAVAFTGSASPGHDVSVDGGKNWGQLAALKIAQADGSVRAAQPADVTHVRWVLKSAIAPNGTGILSLGGVVR